MAARELVGVLAFLVLLAAVLPTHQRILVQAPAGEDDHGPLDASDSSSSMTHVYVPTADVEPLSHVLRVHYTKFMRRMLESNGHRDIGPRVLCDPDECYSHCYLQGFRSGTCKQDKCFCTQASTMTLPPPLQTTDF